MLNVSEHAQREVTPALRWRELIAKAGELWLLRKTHNTLFPLTEGRPPHPAWPAPAVHAFSPNSRCVCVCMCVCVCTRACMLSSLQLSVTPWTVACLAFCSWDSPGKDTGVGCHALLQGIFPDQGVSPSLLCWPLAPSLGKSAPKWRRKKPKI